MSQDTTNTEMNGETLDIAEQRKRELQQLFPGAFTETMNEQGEFVTSVDFERLKAELGEFTDTFESRREKYGMVWPGKRDALRLVQEPSRATLKPCREESVNFDNTENLFIEGDNLEVLKLLQKSYYGKVKMIYIDPPYNTGKEFIYPDKYSESLETYLSYAGLVDDEGRKFTTNTAAEGRFHTKWLNMMYPRLYLARNLLRDDGVIFISIDDNEVENLRRICDEIFGEENFLSQLIIQSNRRGQTYKEIAKCHEYLLVYYKSNDSTLGEIEKKDGALPFSDKHGQYDLWELRNRNPKFGRHNRPNLFYPIYVNPQATENDGLLGVSLSQSSTYTTAVYPRNSEGADSCWRWGKEKLLKEGIQGKVPAIWGKQKRDGGWNIYEKSRKNTTKAKSIWADTAVINEQGTVEAGRIDMGGLLEFPKPVELIKRATLLGSEESEDIILDFFAGSGTTAHAVFLQSLEDGIPRKCISVQLPEPTYEIVNGAKRPKKNNLKAFEQGYNTISAIAIERIRRAAKKIQSENPDYKGDLGFKVLKLDQSNFKQWQAPDRKTTDEDLIQQMELHIDHIQETADPEAILYELLIKAGFMPTEKVETITLAGKTVYSIAEGGLLVCLEDEVNHELIQAVADAEPARFICLDKAFGGNDQLKANAVQTFKSLNQNREIKIEFRTV